MSEIIEDRQTRLLILQIKCAKHLFKNRTGQMILLTLSPESRVKRDCFKLPPNSRGLKTARL